MSIVFVTKEKLSYNEAAPSRILNLKEALSPYHDVHIIAQKGGNVKDSKTYLVKKFGNNFISNQIFKIMLFFYSIYIVLSKKINFFVARQYYLIIFIYPIAKIFNIQLYYDMHCFRYKELLVEEKKLKSKFVSPFETLCHNLSDKLLIISKGLYDDLKSKLRKKVIMLPNGVNLTDFDSIKKNKSLLKKYNIPDSKPIILFLGNWMEWVDVHTFLEASKYAKDCTFLVIGEGYETGSYAGFKDKYPNAVFTGKIDHFEALSILKSSDICILPYKKTDVVKHLSVRKTFEYLAAGKPIIMSNSKIQERNFLKEKENYIIYDTMNSKSLSDKIKYLLKNKALMNKMGKNNETVSKSFNWKDIIYKSDLLKNLETYDFLKKKPDKKPFVSIIIKALNEEEHIEECITSALNALKDISGEVILVDSKSTDNTIKIAKKFPIKIIQLEDEAQRRCGVGPQIGYLHSKGDYIYILDGDMVLDSDFVKKGIEYLQIKRIAGVGGNIFEKSQDNLVFQVKSRFRKVKNTSEITQLGMGGLYKRSIIDEISYFSNPFFYAYEEYDLSAMIRKKGYKLLRIPYKMIDHYGDHTSGFKTLGNRWKSKYLFGSGQYLKMSFGKYFFKAFSDLIIYVFTLFWILLGLFSIISLIWTLNILLTYIFLTLIGIFVLLIMKQDISKLFFSIVSWVSQSIGMVVGLFIKARTAKDFREKVKVIK